jgi:hypothetical protein
MVVARATFWAGVKRCSPKPRLDVCPSSAIPFSTRFLHDCVHSRNVCGRTFRMGGEGVGRRSLCVMLTRLCLQVSHSSLDSLETRFRYEGHTFHDSEIVSSRLNFQRSFYVTFLGVSTPIIYDYDVKIM